MNRRTMNVAIAAGITGSMLVAAGCNAILGAGYSEEAADAGDASVGMHDGATSDSPSTMMPDSDACASDPDANLGKAGLEANLCGPFVCTPGDNGAVLDSGHCALGDGTITCAVPTYVAPDASPPPPPADAGGGDAMDDGDEPDASDAAPPPPTLPSCSSIAGSSPIASNPSFVYPAGPAVFAIGSTAIQPYVGSIAQEYAAGVPDGTGTTFGATVIYVGAGSCVGVEAAYTPPGGLEPESLVTALARNGVAKVASGANLVYAATYYDPASPAAGQFPTSYTCAIDPNDPVDQAIYANVGLSDVFPSSCTSLPPAWGATPPSDPLANDAYQDFFGPVQVMEMVVPTRSPATSITYEQAELVWGYGGAAGIAPWTDPTFLFKRSASSGTQTMIGAAVGLDPRVWKGVTNASSGAIVTALENVIDTGLADGGAGSPTTAVPEAMGILSSDYTGANATTLRALAFQDKGESCAWTPSSSSTSFDARNVRDGHYPIWGPSHLIASVTGGVPTNPVVNRLYAALNGQDPNLASKLDVVKLYATHFLVPNCAMHVTRASDGQSYSTFQPQGRTACSCYYDSVVPLDQPDAACTVCTTDADCASASPARVCNIFSGTTGYCELLGN